MTTPTAESVAEKGLAHLESIAEDVVRMWADRLNGLDLIEALERGFLAKTIAQALQAAHRAGYQKGIEKAADMLDDLFETGSDRSIKDAATYVRALGAEETGEK